MQTDIKILGGLPVTVEFSVCPAEPDVGIMGEYVDEWDIVAIADKPCPKSPGWLHNKINKTHGEEDRILAACCEAIQSARDDYEIERGEYLAEQRGWL